MDASEADLAQDGGMTSPLGLRQRHAAAELLAGAVTGAARALSAMLDDDVRVAVPAIDFLSRAESAGRVDGDTGRQRSIALRQRFEGPVAGEVMLIFPEARSLALVRTILADAVPLEAMTELEQEALVELGNVLLNACLANVASRLGRGLESSLPRYVRGSGRRILLGPGGRPGTDLVVLMQLDLVLPQQSLAGYVALVLDSEGCRRFGALLDDCLAGPVA